MTSKYNRVFDDTKPVYARKPFLANGRHYDVGDMFDWRKVCVTKRRTKLMFEMGKLRHAEDDAEVALEQLADAGQYWESDGLDAIDDLKELRRIADEEGAPYKVSKADQRQAIRDHRKGEN